MNNVSRASTEVKNEFRPTGQICTSRRVSKKKNRRICYTYVRRRRRRARLEEPGTPTPKSHGLVRVYARTEIAL